MIPARLDFHMPTRLLFGVGQFAHVGELARTLGRRALVVATPELPHFERLQELLQAAGVETVPFTDTRANPLAHDLDRAGALAREESCDVVVGIGGGSAMDTAKCAALLAVNEGSIWEYSLEVPHPREATGALPKILLPTTAGTGSEVNFVAVIGNAETRQKGPVRSVFNYPDYAVVDPKLTLTMPERVTASTGFDAFTHAFERFMQPQYHPFSEALALDVIGTVFECLPQVLNDPDNLELRSRLAWASTQAAITINCQLGEAGLHIFGLPLSAVRDLPHGVTLATMLPMVLQDLVDVFPRQAAKLAELLGEDLGGVPESVAAKLCLPAMAGWLEAIGMNYRLSDLGCTRETCHEFAAAINMDRLHDCYHVPVDAEGVLERYLARL